MKFTGVTKYGHGYSWVPTGLFCRQMHLFVKINCKVFVLLKSCKKLSV